MADISSGRKADNVAASDQWVDEARMGFPLATKGARGLRPVPGLLGVPDSGGLLTPYSFFELRRLANLARGYCASCPEYLSSSSTEDRLANQVRGDGD